MNRDDFLKKLKELSAAAAQSPDPTVVKSAITLYGLSGAIQAGPDFLEAFTDTVGGVIKNQRAMLG